MTKNQPVTLAQVKAFCEKSLPLGKNEGEGTGMLVTIWEYELISLLKQTFPGRNYCDIVNSNMFIRQPERARTAFRLRREGTIYYAHKVLKLAEKMVGNDSADAVSAIAKISNGNFRLPSGGFFSWLRCVLKRGWKPSLLTKARKLRIMAAARLIADQLSIPYSEQDAAWKQKLFADEIAGVYADLWAL